MNPAHVKRIGDVARDVAREARAAAVLRLDPNGQYTDRRIELIAVIAELIVALTEAITQEAAP